MIQLTIEESGVIFRNPLPGHRVMNVFYPMVLPLANHELLCVARIAAALYAPGAWLEIFRSTDGGSTWQREGPVTDRKRESPTYSYSDAYLTRLRDGSLVLRAGRWNFVDPDQLAFSHQTQGLMPIEVCYLCSVDDGRTWSQPAVADFRSHFGPGQEPAPQGGIVELPDGAWFQGFETWKSYENAGPFELNSYGLFSRDQGRTWHDRVTVASGVARNLSHSHGIPIRLE
ncbi:MAG: sialidase family protein, partial [Acidobacteria bacterium]|nr:sialidase family protein [Acidobacteriota bacterium]